MAFKGWVYHDMRDGIEAHYGASLGDARPIAKRHPANIRPFKSIVRRSLVRAPPNFREHRSLLDARSVALGARSPQGFPAGTATTRKTELAIGNSQKAIERSVPRRDAVAVVSVVMTR
jgi:hypothetical protein